MTQALVPVWALVLAVVLHGQWSGRSWMVISVEVAGVLLIITGIILTLRKPQ
jgi:drug/metabolite transporter (DMT)-like permease